MAYRILVIGAYGMLGHDVCQYFSGLDDLEVNGLVRAIDHRRPVQFSPDRVRLVEADLLDSKQWIEALDRVKPDIVINTAADLACKDWHNAVRVNAAFPQLLASVCNRRSCLVYHISTDGVFDGEDGKYYFDSLPNATDIYGLSKFCGECPSMSQVVRTSIVGFSLPPKRSGLLDWFFNTPEKQVTGYTNHIWSGMTTLAFAKMLYVHFKSFQNGVVHAATSPISKYDMLTTANRVFFLDKEIRPLNQEYRIDRSLVPSEGWAVSQSFELLLREYANFKGYSHNAPGFALNNVLSGS